MHYYLVLVVEYHLPIDFRVDKKAESNNVLLINQDVKIKLILGVKYEKA